MLIKRDPDTIRSYFEDSSNLKGGFAESVAFPEGVEELSEFLREANSKKTPVTVSGGGTATTGSRVPFGGAVVSIERLNKIYEVSSDKRSAILQAGVLVEDLKDAAEKKGLFYMCHPTEKTATVGGTVSTNASGARSFKYGPTRRYVKKLKMILAGGDILEIYRGQASLSNNNSDICLPDGRKIHIPLPSYKMPLVKNAAGYFAKDGMDLIDLFIGQEGTLSVIAEIELELVKRPSKIFDCFVFFKKKESAWDFVKEVKKVSDILSLEYFDSNALTLLASKFSVIPAGINAAIMLEQETDNSREGAQIDELLGLITKYGSSSGDTLVAMNEKEIDNFIEMRHAVPEAVNEIIKRRGMQKLSTDLAVPDDKFFEMMNYYVDFFKKNDLEHVIFGHIGESHLHVNILPRSDAESAKARQAVLNFVKKAIKLGGTVSAEHGIGKIKHKYLEEMYGKRGILEMAKIKKALDPNCILGLDNIFPKEIL